MQGIVENLNSISTTIEDILDFVATDKVLSNDFELYLTSNDIEINSQRDFNNCIIQYVLDMKMRSGIPVLEYYKTVKKPDSVIIDALKNSFVGVFKIEKILSNAYEVYCLTSEINLTLIPMVKMYHLKQIGRYDFINARIIELNNTLYILEIYDIISEYNAAAAYNSTIKALLVNPVSAYFKNDEKKLKMQNNAKDLYKKFIEFFNCEFVVTTNKKADDLLKLFNSYVQTANKSDYSELIEKMEEYKYFKIEEFNSFDIGSISGFSTHKETYDIALFADKKQGMYVIPFFDTFLKCFKDEIENKTQCLLDFLTNDKIPVSVLNYAYKNNTNFIDVINSCMETNFTSFDDVVQTTKQAHITMELFSPLVTLYNSKVFSDLLEQ